MISLRSALSRRAHVGDQMAAAGLSFQFFDAVDGDAESRLRSLQLNRLRFQIVSRRLPVPGELGCYASHRAVWQHCAELGEPIVVLEDDFRLAPGFAQALDTVEALTREHGFIRLESLYRPMRRLSLRPRPPVHAIRDYGGLTLYYVADVPTSMVGYAIAPSAAASLVEASTPVGAPVDRFVQRTWTHGVPVFGIEPPLVTAAAVAGESTIGLRTRSRHPLLLILRLANSVWGQLRRRRFNRAQLQRLGLIPAGASSREAAAIVAGPLRIPARGRPRARM